MGSGHRKGVQSLGFLEKILDQVTERKLASPTENNFHPHVPPPKNPPLSCFGRRRRHLVVEFCGVPLLRNARQDPSQVVDIAQAKLTHMKLCEYKRNIYYIQYEVQVKFNIVYRKRLA